MSNKKVFIVEDEQAHFKAYEEIFKGEGLNVVGTTTSSDANIRISSEKPDVIILDIMLPGGANGFDILKELKNNPDTKNIPVVVLTNLDNQEKEAYEMGAAVYLVKANTTKDQIVKTVMKFIKN